MMFKIRIQLLVGSLFFFVANLQSQNPGRYLYMNAGTGNQSLHYKLDGGLRNSGSGSSFSLGYVHMYTLKLGLQTGLGLESLTSSATMNLMTGEPAIDTDGDAYVFRTYYKNLREIQHVTFVDVPLGLFFRQPVGEKFGWMAMAGAKVSFPIKSVDEVASGQIVTTGYYDQWNVELADMPRHGFYSTDKHFSSNFNINPALSLYADGGVFYRLSNNADLYFGGYLSYGLNSVSTSKRKLIYQQDGVYNGVLSSAQASRLVPICIGVKMGLYLQLGERRISCW